MENSIEYNKKHEGSLGCAIGLIIIVIAIFMFCMWLSTIHVNT